MSWLTVTVHVDPGTVDQVVAAQAAVSRGLCPAPSGRPVDEAASVDSTASVVDHQDRVSARCVGRRRRCHVDRTGLAGELPVDSAGTDAVEQFGSRAVGAGGGW
jgi:hypothetical protein